MNPYLVAVASLTPYIVKVLFYIALAAFFTGQVVIWLVDLAVKVAKRWL